MWNNSNNSIKIEKEYNNNFNIRKKKDLILWENKNISLIIKKWSLFN